jgi:hypothetical protein
MPHPQVVDTIVELAQVMRDLSTLVVEQGTMLDRIDHNITEAAVKVGSGPGWRGLRLLGGASVDGVGGGSAWVRALAGSLPGGLGEVRCGRTQAGPLPGLH